MRKIFLVMLFWVLASGCAQEERETETIVEPETLFSYEECMEPWEMFCEINPDPLCLTMADIVCTLTTE